MIRIGDVTLDFGDPLTLAFAISLAALVLLIVLVLSALRTANRSSRMVEPLAQHIGGLGRTVESLGQGQERLVGGLRHVSEMQALAQARMIEAIERRLEDVQKGMSDTLHGTATRTARSLGELQQKLEQIDRAQAKIEKLSGDVLSLQDILSNKQTRGAFGEIQLGDIVAKALPPDAYVFQATLSNGKRADCLIRLPNPPGPIVIDAKFPLEAYEALVRADGAEARARALRDLGAAVRVHIKAIAERYIIEGETADGALMFLPSEAVYAELHARLPEVVRAGFDARVWIVSPTTCMATLNTMRAVMKDARMREQAGEIRRALKQLHRDVGIIEERAGKLETHIRQAGEDVAGILTATARAGKRAERLDNFDFEELAPEPAPSGVVPLQRP
ncbi:DNA recombination protein RmuC [Roseicyclus mahoneyensis]|uniref:DNA recombination protein RmuC homolog n=1 Tax=Roseicyclus mahoneyensis TaxID=164332 RepID=A0A316GGD3_9RHOB|nr:DNA recombination protein RmuC [Roseicyclus mahoneyensis]PWK60042.1 DNA recombination protein RmuC [Roseicyclus mahoneyensis]